MNIRKPAAGFTIIELLIVLVVIGILSTLVITTYSGVQSKNRNNDRQANIDTLQGQLETYYAQHNMYPTLANLNNAEWRKANLKALATDGLKDPSWNKDNKICTVDGKAIASNEPADNCYAYQVTTADGSACDNKATPCAQYTLTAKLEGSGKYVKSSLN